MTQQHEDVQDYYRYFESWIGYKLFLSGSKHFGYYPNKKKDISEDEAQRNMQDKIAEKLELTSEDVVLDAGCGEGVVSRYLAEEYQANITGITLVPFEAKIARTDAHSSDAGSKLSYHVMDYSNTAFPDNTFDAVYTTEALCHSPDIERTLRELFRILKPGGRFAFFEYTFDEWEQFTDWQQRMIRIIDEHAGGLNYEEFPHDQFPSVLEEVGFVDVEEENISDYIEPSFWWMHLWSVIPYMIIMMLGAQKYFPNTTIGYEFYKLGKNDLIRYCTFQGRKPD